MSTGNMRRSAVDLALDSIDDSENDRYDEDEDEDEEGEEEKAHTKEKKQEENPPVKAVPKEANQDVALALVDMKPAQASQAVRVSRHEAALGAALDSIDESYNSNCEEGDNDDDDVGEKTKDEKRRPKEEKESKNGEKEANKKKPTDGKKSQDKAEESKGEPGPCKIDLKIDLVAAQQMKWALQDMRKKDGGSETNNNASHRQSAVNIAVDSIDDDDDCDKETRPARRKTAADCSRRSTRTTRSTIKDDHSRRSQRSSTRSSDDNHHHHNHTRNTANMAISMDAAAAVARARACVEELKPVNVPTYRPNTELATKMMADAGEALRSLKVNARTGALAEIRSKKTTSEQQQ